LCVLVVEDHVDTADTTATVLLLDGHEVQIARDRPAALEACKSRWPDVVLLDLALPGCDGYEVVRRIREQARARPRPMFVVISGYGAAIDMARSRAADIHLHFPKPLDPEVLLTLLRKFAVMRFGGP
jgi:two-component system CheB/CheR fusion protein